MSADLGRLGDKSGAPVEVSVPFGRVPLSFLGWAVLLGLMLLAPNRCARAWSVWVLLILLQGTLSLVGLAFGAAAPGVVGPYAGLVFALGTLWLVMPYLSSKGWPATFWGAFLLILIGTCVFGFGRIGAAEESGFLIFLIYVGFNSGLAFALALRSVRKNPNLGALIAWLLLWTGVLWVVTALPWVVIGMVEEGLVVLAATFVVFIAASVGFGVTTAFLLLSTIDPFYQARFTEFICKLPAPQTQTVPPVIISPTS